MPQDEVEKSPEDLALEESLAALAADEQTKKAVPANVTEEFEAEKAKAEPSPDKAETKEDVEDKTSVVESETKVVPEEQDKKSREVNAIVALRRHSQLLAERLAAAEGQTEVLTKLLMQREQPQAVQTKDRLAEIAEAKLALADKADAGEITLRQYEEGRSTLEDEAVSIRIERAQPKQVPQVVKQPEEDLYLAEQTANIIAKYPFLEELTVEDLEPFHKLALREAAREGNPIQPGAKGTLELRKRMMELAAKVYQPSAAKPEVKAESDLSAQQQAALEKKLKLQQEIAPDVRNLGSSGESAGMTVSQLEAKIFDPNLSEEESLALLNGLSPALRKKLGV